MSDKLTMPKPAPRGREAGSGNGRILRPYGIPTIMARQVATETVPPTICRAGILERRVSVIEASTLTTAQPRREIRKNQPTQNEAGFGSTRGPVPGRSGPFWVTTFVAGCAPVGFK